MVKFLTDFSPLNKIIFLLFFLSGFCGLLYQIVWVRMAYASFGVITPVLSVVISVFMLGLSLGAFIGGRWINRLAHHYKASPIIFYALAEFLIGLGAFAVPKVFSLGEHLLLSSGEMNSLRYLLFSGAIIAIAILPWCILMGFTYPFMMAFLKESDTDKPGSFSYLYFANCLGAMCGTLLTAMVLIELAGFYNTLLIAASLNFLICIISITTSFRYSYKSTITQNSKTRHDKFKAGKVPLIKNPAFTYFLLLLTGFTSMAMEVVWVRAFTPVLLTTIYSFAGLLTVYLFATWIGSSVYRKRLKQGRVLTTSDLLAYLAVFSFLPAVINDPRLTMSIPIIMASIVPFCAALGYLTPKLIDEYSYGRPPEAGKAYAVNIAGCIIGPLFASYVLLPKLGVKLALVILAVPFLAIFVAYYKNAIFKRVWSTGMTILAGILFLISAFISVSYEELFALQKGSVIRRDYTATVISAGQGMQKRLLVNGVGITSLLPITKMMAHLPLASCQHEPTSALVICLGMGTTFRSALSWNIKVTAVELVPSVKDALGYYFSDAEGMLKNPNGKIVIDDGRRFLNRTNEVFDVITIDPPPPAEAAGSSLLYSEEFYDLIKKHLKKEGILQQWFASNELKIIQAVARSIANSFPYVKVYISTEGWGFHFLASMSPIDQASAQEMVSRMPMKARDDMMEWFSINDPVELMQLILDHEVPLERILNNNKRIVITDDRPYNEYYFLRRKVDWFRGRVIR